MTLIDAILGRQSAKDVKIQTLEWEVRQLQATQAAQSTNIGRLDVRLDQYGPQLAEMFGGMVTAHTANRWNAVTTVDIDGAPVFRMTAKSNLNGATLYFEGLAYNVAPLTINLLSQPGSDFLPADLQDIEDWITFARTGIAVDYNRHNDRKSKLDKLLRAPADADTDAIPVVKTNGQAPVEVSKS